MQQPAGMEWDETAFEAALKRAEEGVIDAAGVRLSEDQLRRLLEAAPEADERLGHPRLSAADFGGATFSGDADFAKVTFSGDANFRGATFSGIADFGEATFRGFVGFGGATFSGEAKFGLATLSGDANFGHATFNGSV